MTGVEAEPKKGFFSSLSSKKDQNPDAYLKKCPQKKVEKAKKEKKGGNDDDSVSSVNSSGEKNFLGMEKKKPRAEFQAEIDELKLKLVAEENEVAMLTNQLNRYKNWVRQAPN